LASERGIALPSFGIRRERRRALDRTESDPKFCGAMPFRTAERPPRWRCFANRLSLIRAFCVSARRSTRQYWRWVYNFFCSAKVLTTTKFRLRANALARACRVSALKKFKKQNVVESRISSAFVHCVEIFAKMSAMQKVFRSWARRRVLRTARQIAGRGAYTQN
jgi:hypothetical protein